MALLLFVAFPANGGHFNRRLLSFSRSIARETCQELIVSIPRVLEFESFEEVKPMVWVHKLKDLRRALTRAGIHIKKANKSLVFEQWMISDQHPDSIANFVFSQLYSLPFEVSPTLALFAPGVGLLDPEAKAKTFFSPWNFEVMPFASSGEPNWSIPDAGFVFPETSAHLGSKDLTRLWRGLDLILLPLPFQESKSDLDVALDFVEWLGMLAHEAAHSSDMDLISHAIAAFSTNPEIFPILGNHFRYQDGKIQIDEPFFNFFIEMRGYWMSKMVVEIYKQELKKTIFEYVEQSVDPAFLDRYGINETTALQIAFEWSDKMLALALRDH